MSASLSYRWKRLRSMTGDEIVDRVRQHVMSRLDFQRFKYGKNVVAPPVLIRPEKPGRFFFAPKDVPELCSLLRERMPGQVTEIIAQAEKIRAKRFDLLGYENLAYGSRIDW